MMEQHRNSKDQNSISSNDSSTFKTVWHRLSHLFHSPEDSNRRLSTSSSESDSSSNTVSSNGRHNNRIKHRQRRKKVLSTSEYSISSLPQPFVIPPYSPTYCKANEFPYSNFYVKLPNGKWMVRYRSGNRDILGTDEFEGYMI